MHFLFVGPNVCRQLLSDSQSPTTPLLLANTPYCKAYSGLSPYSAYPCLTHIKSDTHSVSPGLIGYGNESIYNRIKNSGITAIIVFIGERTDNNTYIYILGQTKTNLIIRGHIRNENRGINIRSGKYVKRTTNL